MGKGTEGIQDCEGQKSPSHVWRWRRALLAKGTACAKILRQARAGTVRGNSWRPEEAGGGQWDGGAGHHEKCGLYCNCSGSWGRDSQDSRMMSFVSKPPFGCCVEHRLRRTKNWCWREGGGHYSPGGCWQWTGPGWWLKRWPGTYSEAELLGHVRSLDVGVSLREWLCPSALTEPSASIGNMAHGLTVCPLSWSQVSQFPVLQLWWVRLKVLFWDTHTSERLLVDHPGSLGSWIFHELISLTQEGSWPCPDYMTSGRRVRRAVMRSPSLGPPFSAVLLSGAHNSDQLRKLLGSWFSPL